ncbi:TlpA disulfide reductase family protein [Rehaibacterium terrae]|uniref:Thiol-disulfide isomerase/thioredoxin n=1 Tax=Rehaibacterium terrae TaxID=1341696 RepID=A0A7W7XZU2_9GAMM|nr:thiol-disulfide isomerase/thioredoxin [Rehaibacterium terrae]
MSASSWRGHLAIVAVAVLAGAAGLWAGRWWSLPAEQPVPAGVTVAKVGDLRPDLHLPDLDGMPQPLSRWDGRPLLINFWASWCGPCIEEMPLLDAFAAEQGDNGVQVLGIALDSAEAVHAFLEQVPVRYPILLDSPAADDSSVRLGNTRGVLPYSVLIAADGRVRKQKLGVFSAAELRRWATE